MFSRDITLTISISTRGQNKFGLTMANILTTDNIVTGFVVFIFLIFFYSIYAGYKKSAKSNTSGKESIRSQALKVFSHIETRFIDSPKMPFSLYGAGAIIFLVWSSTNALSTNSMLMLGGIVTGVVIGRAITPIAHKIFLILCAKPVVGPFDRKIILYTIGFVFAEVINIIIISFGYILE